MALIAVLTAAGATATDSSMPLVTEMLDRLKPARTGADHLGNLWIFAPHEGRMVLADGSLAVLKTADGVFGSNAAADAEWGVAYLTDGGLTLTLRGWCEPVLRVTHALDGPYFGLEWIGPSRIALAPKRGPHRVEIWNLDPWECTMRLGLEEAATDEAGPVQERATFLEVDHTRQRLTTMESYSGNVQVFDLTQGGTVWRSDVDHPDRMKLGAYLDEQRAQAALSGGEGSSYLTLIVWDGMAVAPDGAVWLVESCKGPNGAALLYRLQEGKTPERVSARVSGCCSRRLSSWKSHLVFVRDPDGPDAICSGFIDMNGNGGWE
jgi:hypothetical protein